jgi:glyoxylase-like metal-dependent hydrolase (beta-lactamase superfamily II)
VTDTLYFRQWLAGRDFAKGDAVARSMANFVYAIGDKESGEALLVDPAWAPDELVALLDADGMKPAGALATHYHFDHVGGEIRGHHIAGIAALLELADVPIHVNAAEAAWIARQTSVGDGSLVTHDSGDVVTAGAVSVTLLHTPGHTPGSQCFLVDDKLVSGDTLFLEGCGRTDLPGSDPEELYRSLTERLARVSDETWLFPGHNYAAERSAPMGEVRRFNYALAPATAEQWLAMFAR